MRGLKERFEIHHGNRIKDQALIDAVTLSSKYIPDRFLPDKAIDIVDEAASRVRIRYGTRPSSLKKLKEVEERYRKDKEAALANQQYDDAAEL
jgi:ATP-dependent Clp protease ATP-binding subunit ClpC